MSSALAALAGVCFVVLGRWIYRNPRSLYVREVHASPDAPLPRLGAKVFGTLAIFIGSYAVVAGIADLVVASSGTMVVTGAIIVAAISAFLLTPTVKSGRSSETGQRPLTMRAKLLIAVLVAVGTLFTAAVLILIRVGDSALIPLASMIAGGISVAAIAAVLWLPKRAA